MKSGIRSIAALLFTLTIPGCGYTVLQRDPKLLNPCAGYADSTLADLSIVRIERLEFIGSGQTVEHFPEPMTNFKIVIQNDGQGVFDGSILCDYASSRADIRAKRDPAHAGPVTVVLYPGDTTVIQETIAGWYARHTHLRFALRTDSFPLHTFDAIYYFGREPVCETSYDNSIADFFVE